MANIIIHDEVVNTELDQWGNPLYEDSPPRNWVELNDTYIIQMTNWAYTTWVLWKRTDNTIEPVYRLEHTDYYDTAMDDGHTYSQGGGFGRAQCARIDDETAIFTYVREDNDDNWISRARIVKRYNDTIAIGPGVTLASWQDVSSGNLLPHVFYTRNVALDGNKTAMVFSNAFGDEYTRAYRFSVNDITLSVEGPDIILSEPHMKLAELVYIRDSEIEMTFIDESDNHPHIYRFEYNGGGNWTDTTARFERHDIHTFRPPNEVAVSSTVNGKIATFGSDRFVHALVRDWSSDDGTKHRYIDVFLCEASGTDISILDIASFTSEYPANTLSGSIRPLQSERLDDTTVAVLWAEPNASGYQDARIAVRTYDIGGDTLTLDQGPFILHDPGVTHHSAFTAGALIRLDNYLAVVFQEYTGSTFNAHCGLLSYSSGVLGSSFAHKNSFNTGGRMGRRLAARCEANHIAVLYEDGSRHVYIRGFYLDGSSFSVSSYSRIHWYTGDRDDFRFPSINQATENTAVVTVAKNNYFTSYEDIRWIGFPITKYPGFTGAFEVYDSFEIANYADYREVNDSGNENFIEAIGHPVRPLNGNQALVTFGVFHTDSYGSDEYVSRWDFSDPSAPQQIGEPIQWTDPDGQETDDWFGDSLMYETFPHGKKVLSYIENYSPGEDSDSWATLELVSGIDIGYPSVVNYIFGDKLRDGEAVYSVPRTNLNDKIVVFTREGSQGLEVVVDSANQLYNDLIWYFAKPATIDRDESEPVVVFVVAETGGQFSIKKVEGFNGTALNITRELEIEQDSEDDVGFVNLLGDKYVGYIYPQDIDWDVWMAARVVELETAPEEDVSSTVCIQPLEDIYIVDIEA